LPCEPIMPETNDAESKYVCEYCNRPFATTDSRSRHIRQSCKAPKNKPNELTKMQSRLEEIERKLAATQVSSAAATQASGPLTQVNGPLTQVTNINTVNTVNNNISVSIRPWGAPLALTDGDVEAALAAVPGLAGTPTLTEVVSTLMELVQFFELKRTHRWKRGTST